MKEDRTGGASGAKISNIAASEAPGRARRMIVRRRQEAVLRVLRGEPLETVARENGVTVADLSDWRNRFLDGGVACLKSRPRDDRDNRITQLQAKLGEITMDNELLYEKIAPGGWPPFGPAEIEEMSAIHAISGQQGYGIVRVCRVWDVSRATVYRSRARHSTPPDAARSAQAP